MASYTWDFSLAFIYWEAIVSGLLLTLELTFYTLIVGTALGLLVALCKLSRHLYLRYPATIYVEVFSGLPLLVLLVWLYYALPILSGITISAFPTAVVALSLNLAAFAAEIFRGGIESVPKGQTEVSLSLGFSKLQILQKIVLPQAVKLIIPPLSGRYIETIKLTSLASVIAVDELLHAGQNVISLSYRPLEVYTVIAFLYLLVILPLSMVLRKIENNN